MSISRAKGLKILVSETEMELCCNKNRLGSHASVARIVTRPKGWAIRGSNPGRGKGYTCISSSKRPFRLWEPSASSLVSTGGSFFFTGGMGLTTHFCVGLRLRMSGSVPPLFVCAGTTSPLPFTEVDCVCMLALRFCDFSCIAVKTQQFLKVISSVVAITLSLACSTSC